jgi:hypothetical protein
MAGVGMLTASWLLCRAQHAPERLVYGVLWALMVLLMNMHDVSESVAGLAIALLTLMVCSSAGERVKRFWPRHFFMPCSIASRCNRQNWVLPSNDNRCVHCIGETMIPLAYRITDLNDFIVMAVKKNALY